METKAAGHNEQHKHGNMKLSKKKMFFPSVLTWQAEETGKATQKTTQ